MKKLLILTAVGTILTAPATAVQKCIAYDSTTTCAASEAVLNYLGRSEWTGTCTTKGTTISIVGIGKCSSTSGSVSSPRYNTSLTSSLTHLDNKYCYCRIISPFVSNWVFANMVTNSDATKDSCEYACANYCAQALNGSNANFPSWFKSYLFTAISD